MIDLHCHILPGIDDGPGNLEEALVLLREEAKQGIQKIIMTPHFRPGQDSLESFLKNREESFQRVCRQAERMELSLDLQTGAEIYFSMELAALDLKPLCLGSTDYLLIELPTDYHPYGVRETCYRLQQNGYLPILAHVERYSYIRRNPVWLYELVCAGNLAQINAEALFNDKKTKQFVKKLLKWGMVHLIATDTHGTGKRPPRLKEALDIIDRECGTDMVNALKKNAEKVFCGKEFYLPEPKKPENTFGIWR